MGRANSLEKTLMLEKLKAGGEGDDRGRDGWMVSPTQWTWVWVSSGSWWWTGKPGMLHSMESQRVGHDWVAELNFLEKCSAFQAFLAHLLTSTLISLFWSRCLHMMIMESLCVLMAVFQDTSVHDNLWVLTGLCPQLIDLALGTHILPVTDHIGPVPSIRTSCYIYSSCPGPGLWS